MIRKAVAQDTESLAKMLLQFNAFEERLDPEFKSLGEGSLEGFKEYVKKGIEGKDNEFVLVAERQGKTVGLIYCQEKKRLKVFKIEKNGYVNDLFVAQEERGKGTGKKLMEAAEQEFKKRGIEFICLTALSNNENALKAYKKLGFKEFKKEMRKKI